MNERRAFRLLVPAVGILLTAACATHPGKAPTHDGYVRYRCPDKQEFGVTFQQQGRRALLEAGGWSQLLPSAGSGSKYSDGKITLWIKGNVASVDEDGRTTYRNCAVVSKK